MSCQLRARKTCRITSYNVCYTKLLRMRYELSVESPEDLDARVIRSTSGTIRIPEMGIIVEPGTVSDSYITNIEGVLQRVQKVLMTASKWVQEDEEKFSYNFV